MTRKMIVLVGVLMLVASACATGGNAADAGAAATPALTPTTVHTPAVSAPNGSDTTSEGIQVHGHWTIEVRNPDGSVAEAREFDNDLTVDGSIILARLLYGDRALTADSASGLPVWWIRLDPLTELYSAQTSLIANGDGTHLVLTASAQAQVAADISGVASVANYEIVGVGTPTEFRLTSTTIYPTIPVEANQTAYVTVLVSFS